MPQTGRFYQQVGERMYRVAVRSGFSASHALRLSDGRYEDVHRHDWVVQACFAGSQLDSTGMLVDFEQVAPALEEILGRLENSDLNSCPLLSGVNPSAENVARVIFETLAGVVERGKLLESVCVEEAPGCTATYHRGGPAGSAVDAARADR